MSHTKLQLLKKKQEAKKLITQLGYNQKETAQKIGVSERTMVAWCREYGWTSSVSHQLKQLYEGSLEAFALFVERNDPATYKKLVGHLFSFLTQKN